MGTIRKTEAAEMHISSATAQQAWRLYLEHLTESKELARLLQ